MFRFLRFLKLSQYPAVSFDNGYNIEHWPNSLDTRSDPTLWGRILYPSCLILKMQCDRKKISVCKQNFVNVIDRTVKYSKAVDRSSVWTVIPRRHSFLPCIISWMKFFWSRHPPIVGKDGCPSFTFQLNRVKLCYHKPVTMYAPSIFIVNCYGVYQWGTRWSIVPIA